MGVNGGSDINMMQAKQIQSPSNMDTDSQFVFSNKGGGDTSGRGTENLKEEFVPTGIHHVRSGSKVIRKDTDTHIFASKNESIVEEATPNDSRMQSRSYVTTSQLQGKAPVQGQGGPNTSQRSNSIGAYIG